MKCVNFTHAGFPFLIDRHAQRADLHYRKVAKANLARGRCVETAEDIEQGRLAASGRSQQHHELCPVKVDIDAAKGRNLNGAHPINLCEVARRQGDGQFLVFHRSPLVRRGDWTVGLTPAPFTLQQPEKYFSISVLH